MVFQLWQKCKYRNLISQVLMVGQFYIDVYSICKKFGRQIVVFCWSICNFDGANLGLLNAVSIGQDKVKKIKKIVLYQILNV